MSVVANTLLSVLLRAAHRVFPEPDGLIEVLPAPPGRAQAIVAFTAHHLIATSAPERWIRDQLAGGDLLAPMSPGFLAALGAKLDRRDDGIDLLLAAPGLGGESSLSETDAGSHPRVLRAVANREEVRVFSDQSAVATVILARGLALRTEVAIEVAPGHRNRQHARSALIQARRLIGEDEVLFAQIAPGNAASIRAFIAAGFQPIASEILYFPND